MATSTTETWHRHTPSIEVPACLYLDRLTDDRDGLVLLLSEQQNGPQLQVLFDGYLSYRNTDEGDLLVTLVKLKDLTPWPLFRVDNSAYLDWFHSESYGIHQGEPIQHFVIATPGDVVEVLTLGEPELTWLAG